MSASFYRFMRGACVSCALFDAYACFIRPSIGEKLVYFVLLIIMTACAYSYTSRIRVIEQETRAARVFVEKFRVRANGADGVKK